MCHGARRATNLALPFTRNNNDGGEHDSFVSVVRGLGMSSVSVRTLKSCGLVALLALTAGCGGGGGDDGERAAGGGGGASQALSRMPNVIGQTEAAARQTVAAAGLTVGIVHVSGAAGVAEPT